LAVLLSAKRQALGRGFGVLHAPAKLVQLATMYGVAELLGLGPESGQGPGADVPNALL
jgi:hypothetical protein